MLGKLKDTDGFVFGQRSGGRSEHYQGQYDRKQFLHHDLFLLMIQSRCSTMVGARDGNKKRLKPISLRR